MVDKGGETKKCQNNAHMLDKRGEIHLLSIDVEFNHLMVEKGEISSNSYKTKAEFQLFPPFESFSTDFFIWLSSYDKDTTTRALALTDWWLTRTTLQANHRPQKTGTSSIAS